MNDILETIIASKRGHLPKLKEETPLALLEKKIVAMDRKPISMKQALLASPSGIIAEFKRRSPSKGWIDREADLAAVAREYELNSASAISVLTDTEFFGGKLDDLRLARATVGLPLLRKDFIVDEYQLYEALEAGADVVLLIAAVLGRGECAALASKARSLGMETLLEIHSEKEMDHISADIDMVGVNNRDLGSFRTDIGISSVLAGLLPKEMVKISESGISEPSTVVKLRELGFRGFLIGENFMKSRFKGESLANFIKSL